MIYGSSIEARILTSFRAFSFSTGLIHHLTSLENSNTLFTQLRHLHLLYRVYPTIRFPLNFEDIGERSLPESLEYLKLLVQGHAPVIWQVGNLKYNQS